jgi:hypothetical protein
MKGCKETKGMCIHDKMMLVVVVLVVGYLAGKFLGLF